YGGEASQTSAVRRSVHLPRLAPYCDGQEHMFGAATELFDALESIEPDVLYAQDPLSALLCGLASRAPDRSEPAIYLATHWTLGHWTELRPRRDWGVLGHTEKGYRFERRFLSNLLCASYISRLVCVGQQFATWAREIGVPDDRMVVLPNSVDV